MPHRIEAFRSDSEGMGVTRGLRAPRRVRPNPRMKTLDSAGARFASSSVETARTTPSWLIPMAKTPSLHLIMSVLLWFGIGANRLATV